MISEEIEQELQEALKALYDPDFDPSPGLCILVGCAPEAGTMAVQSAIIEAIDTLKPEGDVPLSSRLRQVYELLHDHFVLQLTLEETAERMVDLFLEGALG